MMAIHSYVSITTSGSKDLLNAASSQTRSSVAGLINIARNFLIKYPRKAKVLQSFSIKVRPVEDGYVATSNKSDVYELGETSAQAVSNYLSSLVDELIWFQEHQDCLSPSLLKDYYKLHFHLRLV